MARVLHPDRAGGFAPGPRRRFEAQMRRRVAPDRGSTAKMAGSFRSGEGFERAAMGRQP